MSFKPGDRVFAKIKGFSSWPARINPLPPDVTIPKGKVPVFFYGTYQVSFVPTKNVVPYEEFKEKWGKPKSNTQFMTALEEIESNPGMLMLGEDPEAESYLSQFYDFKRSGGGGNARRRRGSRTTAVVRRGSPMISTGSTKSDVTTTTTTTTETSDAVSTGGPHSEDHHQHNNDDEGGEESEPIDASPGEAEDELLPSAGLEEPARAADSAYSTDRQARRAARKLAKKAEKKALKKAVKREAKRMYKASKRAERRARREAKRERRRTFRQESEPLEPDEQRQRLVRHSILDEDLAAYSEADTEVAADASSAKELLAGPRDRSPDVRPSVDVDLDRRHYSGCPAVVPGGRQQQQSRSPLTGSSAPRLAYAGSMNASNFPSVAAAAVAAVASSPPAQSLAPGDYCHLPATLSPMELLTAAAELVAESDRPPSAVVGARQAKRRHPASDREQSPASSAKPTEKSSLPEGHKKSKPSATPEISVRTAVVNLTADSQPQHNCDPVSRLKQTCHELKGCLVRGHEQFQLAVKLLILLTGVEVRLPELAQVRELMDCVKKCRRYKLSSDVREAAEKVLQHFQTIRSRATKEEFAEAHMLLTSGLANSTGPSTKPVTPPPLPATANNANRTQQQPAAKGKASSGSPPLPLPTTANSLTTTMATTTTRASESENLAADLEARVDDVLSRIRATEERMAATARANANPTSTNSVQPGASTQPGGVVTVGHTIRASAVAAAAAHMHDEEDEEEVMLRVEQVAAFQAASRGGTLPAAAEPTPPECPALAPPVSPVSSSNDVDVDLDLDTRIEKLRTCSASGEPPPPSSSTSSSSSSSRRHSAAPRSSGSAAAAATTATTNSNSMTVPRLASRRDKLLVPVETDSSAGTAAAAATRAAAATIEKDDELYDLLGV